jgi:hypothetical protein
MSLNVMSFLLFSAWYFYKLCVLKHPQATRIYLKAWNKGNTLVGVSTAFLKKIVTLFEKDLEIPSVDDFCDEPHFLELLKTDKTVKQQFKDDPKSAEQLIRRANKEAHRREVEADRKALQEKLRKDKEEDERRQRESRRPASSSGKSSSRRGKGASRNSKGQ